MGTAIFFAALALAVAPQAADRPIYSGICDGSAIALTGRDRFVTMSDEDPVIYSFPIAGGAGNALPLDLSALLGLGGKEGDFEAAARIGDTIYWIASFGTDGKGNEDPSRRQFFATNIAADGKLTYLGKSADTFFDELAKAPGLLGYDLKTKAGISAKEKGGLNIEGLAATPTAALVIGFRNPLVGPNSQKALIAILSNPTDVVAGKAPDISEVAEIDLGGRGIRDIVYRPAKGDYLIVAGAVDRTPNFALYRWSGKLGDAPQKLASDLSGLNPEAIAVLSDGRLLVLSDDGEEPVKPSDKECKSKKKPAAEKQFRSVILPSPD